jgi:ribonuclease HII
VYELIAGCDEVGRGCLAGPVVAAAVVLPPDFPYPLMKDSKQLTAKQRILLDAIIREEAIDRAIGLASPQEIDQINILNTSHLAMHRAINQLKIRPGLYPLLKDSKQLTAKQRILLDAIIQEEAIDWAIGFASPQEIDQINILNASLLAMHRAIDQLKTRPEILLIDGNIFKPYPNIKHKCIIRGDEQVSSIAAASVIAKVYRDRYMEELSLQIPGYGWEHNMGYPTKAHRLAIHELGITAYHRKTFRQVADKLHLSLWDS